MQMLMTSPNYIPATRRMHVGKEFEQFKSIDWYDNEARFYDSTTLCSCASPRPTRSLLPIPLPLRLLRKQTCKQSTW